MEIMSAYLMGNGHPNAPANTFESKRYAAALMDMETKLLGDMFGIDDLLDFSNEEIGAPIGKEAFPVQASQQQGIIGNNFQAIDTIGESIISSNLDNADQQTEVQAQAQAQAQTAQNQVLDFAVHCEELAELEWLSNFVEDSSSIADAKPEGAYNVALVKDHTKESIDQTGLSASTGGSLIIDQYSNLSSPSSPLILEIENDEDPTLELAKFPVPSRARSNRPRKPTKSWAVDILSAPAIAESGITTTTDTISDYTDTVLIESPNHELQFITPESSSDSGFVSSPDLNTGTFSCAENPQLISAASPVSTLGNATWAATYKPYSPSSSSGTSGTSNGNGKKRQLDPAHVQRCLHCATQRTPQWRAGPWGPKTLCNACGVRYKSGRLFPEYRPAASPTFVPHIHSNSHRKVLEMRRNSELVSSSSSLFLQWQ